MSRKKILRFLFIFIAVLILIDGFILKNIVLFPGLYRSNNKFGAEENREIKSLVLNSIKDRHSTLFSLNKDELYKESLVNRLKWGSTTARFFFIDINDNFMQSLEKKEDKYLVKICLHFPDDWQYYYTIEEHDGKYIISDIQVDP